MIRLSVQDARSLLFVPGTRADRFDRAAAAGADAVIVDLEDSVAAAEKPGARAAAHDWLAAGNTAVVRINGVGTPWHEHDLAMVAAAGCPVLLPKAETVASVGAVRAGLPASCALLALIESALGVRHVAELCESGTVDRIAFGSVDFALDVGLDPDAASPTFDHVRSSIVVASAAAGLPAPWDGVTTALGNDERLTADVAVALVAGFGGKLAIHPKQVPAINAAWTPTAEQVRWAEQVLDAVGPEPDAAGVIVVDGQMVDLPVVTRARRLLACVQPGHPG